MSITLRPGVADDAKACGEICYNAFGAIADQHNFPSDFPSIEVAQGLMSMLLGHPGFYSVVAEKDGEVVGSNFLDERSEIAGVGPITIDPEAQNRRIGRTLMEDVMSRAEGRNFAGVRLLQATYHTRSLSLYSKLGFETRELIATIQGPPLQRVIPGYAVRAATTESALQEDPRPRSSRRVGRRSSTRHGNGGGT